MHRKWFVACAFLAASCSGRDVSAHFDTTRSTQQVMKHVIDPAAIALWGRAGAMETENGTVYLTPQTEEDWAAAEHEAAIVAKGGNLLLLPGRRLKLAVEDNAWASYARDLTREALAVKVATAARDSDRMFKAGADLFAPPAMTNTMVPISTRRHVRPTEVTRLPSHRGRTWRGLLSSPRSTFNPLGGGRLP